MFRNLKTKDVVITLVLVVSLLMSGFALIESGKSGDVESMGVTNLSSLTLADDLVVGGTSSVPAMTGGLAITGDADEAQLSVKGFSTQTSDLVLVENSAGVDRLNINNYGQWTITGIPDADAANYDYIVDVDYAMTGTGTKDRTYGMRISGTRAAGQELASGDHDEAGLVVEVDTEAITTTAGATLRAVKFEAKADNPNGTVTNLYGASLTAKSDTSAGDVANMIGFTSNAQSNAPVTALLAGGDIRIMNQSSEPTEEYGLQVRSSSTNGPGADAAIYIKSDYAGSVTTDQFAYGVDFTGAAIGTADIRFENGTTLSEGTDTILTFSEFLGGAEQTAEVVSGGSTIVPTGTWQPISSSGVVTCSTSTCITAGAQDGQLLILQNVNASDAITIDGTGGNVECKSDVVLGARDTLGLLWNGAEWNCLFYYDNS